MRQHRMRSSWRSAPRSAVGPTIGSGTDMKISRKWVRQMLESAMLPHVLRRSVSGSTRYRRNGRGSAVILIHGVGMDCSVWSLQMEALAQGHDVIAYDMLGHGGTSLPPSDARLSDYADQLL